MNRLLFTITCIMILMLSCGDTTSDYYSFENISCQELLKNIDTLEPELCICSNNKLDGLDPSIVNGNYINNIVDSCIQENPINY